MSRRSVGDVVGELLARFPAEWAEPWDRVGLVCGDPQAEVTGVLCALDLEPAVLARARDLHANLVITHHPPFLDDVSDLTPGRGGRAWAWRALRDGIAVASFHTNLDRSPEGAEALPRALGFAGGAPLEDGLLEMDLVRVYCPPEALDAVTCAMGNAGAGRIGRYEGCSFASPGVGTFEPLEGASPTLGAVGARVTTPESAVEMLCPPERTARVLTAARDAHPYEEPVLFAIRTRLSRGVARLGRICESPEPLSLGQLAARAGAAFRVAPRVWGDADAAVARVAFGNGSVGDLLGAAVSAGAQAMVCGEVRYHAAHEASQDGLGIIEIGHDVSESPLVNVLADAAGVAVRDEDIEVASFATGPRWWTGA